MAQTIELEFKGSGDLFGKLEQLHAGVSDLGAMHKKVHDEIQGDLKETTADAQQMGDSFSAAAKATVVLGRSAKDSGLAQLPGIFDKAGQAVARSRAEYEKYTKLLQANGAEQDRLNQRLKANEKQLAEMNKAIADSGVKAESFTAAMAENRLESERLQNQHAALAADEVLLRNALNEAEIAMIDATNASKETSVVFGAQGRAVRVTGQELREVTQRLKDAGVAEDQLQRKIEEVIVDGRELESVLEGIPVPLDPTLEGLESLQQQLRRARLEAGQLAAEFGIDSEQAVVAQRRVAELANSVDSLKKRFDAFNPGQRFQAFNQLTFSLISGFSAIQGITGLIAEEDEDLRRLLFTLQTILFSFTGIQQFLGGFKDSIRTLNAVLGISTTVTEANAVANQQNVVAKRAQAVANVQVTTTTQAATTATRGFTTSLLVNPIFLVVAALGILALAFAAAGDEAEETTRDYQSFLDKLDEVEARSKNKADLEARIQALKDEIAVLQETTEAGKARTAATLEENRTVAQIEKEIAANVATQNAALAERAKLIDDGRRKAAEAAAAGVTGFREPGAGVDLNALRAGQAAAREEAERTFDFRKQLSEEEVQFVDELDARIAKSVEEQTRLQAEKTLVQEKGKNDAIKLSAEEAEARMRIHEQLVAELVALEQQLADRDFQARLQRADPEERLRIQKEQDEKELAQLAEKIKAINRQLTGQAALTVQQEQELANIRLGIQEKYEDDLTALRLEEQKERLQLIVDANEREREAFEIELRERLERLRAFGVQEGELRALQARERAAFDDRQVEEARQIAERIALAEVEQIVDGGKLSRDAEREKQIEILRIRQRFAELALVQIRADGSEETTARIAEARALIAQLTNEINALLSEGGRTQPFNILSLLGISDEDQPRVRTALQGMVSSFRDAMAAIIEAHRAEVDAQIAATDEIISDQQRRRSELLAELEAEQRDREQGFANNVDRVRREIEATKAAEAEALAEKKRLLAERAKIARQEAAIAGITQASQLLSAGATLFAEGAFKGPAGIIASIATIAAMIATFLALQARVRSITTQGLYRGTARVRRAPGEPDGIDTVHAMLTEDEAVIPRGPARKHNRMISALIGDDFSGLRWADIRPMVLAMRPQVNEREFDRIAERGMSTTTINNHMRTEALERRVVELTDEVRGLRSDGRRRRPTTTISLS